MGKQTLFDKLRENHEQGGYPFHMPGHKRNLASPGNLYQLDITEIDGFDSLHHATGILEETSRRAASLYRAEDTFLLVGGSTAGLLCIIAACTRSGGKVLVARNCHKSVYHSIYLNRLQAAYLYPRQLESWGICGGIAPEDVEKALQESCKDSEQFQAVIITSPTYEGVVSDIQAIADCCHAYGVPLIVDEAHGAHFGFSDQMPASAITQGADAVVQSLHKTMPALTQTALLHVCGSLIDRSRVRRFFSVYQTSSPSYLLMGSIDQCISLMETEKDWMFSKYASRLSDCRKRLAGCKHIRLLAPDSTEMKQSACKTMDPGRFVFSVRTPGNKGKTVDSRISGNALMDRLRKDYRLELEMAGLDYVVAIVTVMDTEEGLERLCKAIEELDRELEKAPETDHRRQEYKEAEQSEVVITIADAYDGAYETCLLAESAGRIAAEFLYIYPPGIPIVAPGERITKHHLQQITVAKGQGLSVEGTVDVTLETIRVVK